MAPEVDASQDVMLLGGYQNDTHTVIRFSRPWNTCDKAQDVLLSVSTMTMLLDHKPHKEVPPTMGTTGETMNKIYIKDFQTEFKEAK